ncbi:MAG: MFS transporter [Chloroflexaceae bacterium]|nr:MFS transporter [Chloroflexaceae bacterium]
MQEGDYSKKWQVLGAVSMGIFLSTIDGSIVNLALPTLIRDLNTNFAAVNWVLLIYLLMLTTLMPVVGRIADIIGKKRIYTFGFMVFIIGSALCGLAGNVWLLVGFRVIQAIGAAMILALGPAILTDAFPPSERGRALGWVGLAVSLGIVTGPALGGLIIQYFSWHWIFYVNVPVGLVGIYIVTRVLSEDAPKGGQHFDYAGAATLFFGLLALLLALTMGQQLGFAIRSF